MSKRKDFLTTEFEVKMLSKFSNIGSSGILWSKLGNMNGGKWGVKWKQS